MISGNDLENILRVTLPSYEKTSQIRSNDKKLTTAGVFAERSKKDLGNKQMKKLKTKLMEIKTLRKIKPENIHISSIFNFEVNLISLKEEKKRSCLKNQEFEQN